MLMAMWVSRSASRAATCSSRVGNGIAAAAASAVDPGKSSSRDFERRKEEEEGEPVVVDDEEHSVENVETTEIRLLRRRGRAVARPKTVRQARDAPNIIEAHAHEELLAAIFAVSTTFRFRGCR